MNFKEPHNNRKKSDFHLVSKIVFRQSKKSDGKDDSSPEEGDSLSPDVDKALMGLGPGGIKGSRARYNKSAAAG